jgi:MFS family permease
MPRIGLDPDLVFLVFLPPLLYSAAWTLSWREFQRNFLSIAMLAVGLVLFTVAGPALVAGLLLPGFDWRAAVLLGAVVAATDAIAATFIARRVGLPQRIVDILEAESLVNDGTGLLVDDSLPSALDGCLGPLSTIEIRIGNQKPTSLQIPFDEYIGDLPISDRSMGPNF